MESSRIDRPEPADADHHPLTGGPRIDTRDIFRRMIADELRAGRLTSARRKRIIAYAAGMGLTAVEIGALITDCRAEILNDGSPLERQHALRLVEPPPECVPLPLKLALVIMTALLFDLLFLNLIW